MELVLGPDSNKITHTHTHTQAHHLSPGGKVGTGVQRAGGLRACEDGAGGGESQHPPALRHAAQAAQVDSL